MKSVTEEQFFSVLREAEKLEGYKANSVANAKWNELAELLLCIREFPEDLLFFPQDLEP